MSAINCLAALHGANLSTIAILEIALIVAGVAMWIAALVHGRVHRWLDAPARLPAWKITPGDFLLFFAMVIACFAFAPAGVAKVLDLDLEPPLSAEVLLVQGYAFHLSALAAYGLFRLHPAGRPPGGDTYFIVAFGRGLQAFLYLIPVLTAVVLLWRALLDALGLPTDLQDVAISLREAENPTFEALWIVLIVVVAPVAEECVFRAGLFRFLVSHLSLRSAALLSSFVFASLHQTWLTLVPFVLLGIVLSLVYHKTGRIIAPIVLHILFNLNSVCVILAEGTS